MKSSIDITILVQDRQQQPAVVIPSMSKSFPFDSVLGPSSSQGEVYETVCHPLVDSFFEGYNSTVLAYGQTGSGKTFTMGSASFFSPAPDEAGLIPRVIRDLFAAVAAKRSQTDFEVSCTFLEIYNEEIRDLLAPAARGGGAAGMQPFERGGWRGASVPVKDSKAIRVTEDPETRQIIVVGARSVQVDSAAELLGCLNEGSAVRTTGSTSMNVHSSRSHAIFTISLIQRAKKGTHGRPSHPGSPQGAPPGTAAAAAAENSSSSSTSLSSPSQAAEQTTATDSAQVETVDFRMSKFHFVDLAGSERAKRTRAEGARLREGIHINGGLLALGNVICALTAESAGNMGGRDGRDSHVPYRDSKLTRILQDSLGGNSKTVMIACVSGAVADLTESVNTIRYASRARNIKNSPVINRDPTAALICALRQQVHDLTSQLLATRKAQVRLRHGATQLTEEEAERIRGPNGLTYKELEDQVAELTGRLRAEQDKRMEVTKIGNEKSAAFQALVDHMHEKGFALPEGSEATEIAEKAAGLKASLDDSAEAEGRAQVLEQEVSDLRRRVALLEKREEEQQKIINEKERVVDALESENAGLKKRRVQVESCFALLQARALRRIAVQQSEKAEGTGALPKPATSPVAGSSPLFAHTRRDLEEENGHQTPPPTRGSLDLGGESVSVSGRGGRLAALLRRRSGGSSGGSAALFPLSASALSKRRGSPGGGLGVSASPSPLGGEDETAVADPETGGGAAGVSVSRGEGGEEKEGAGKKDEIQLVPDTQKGSSVDLQGGSVEKSQHAEGGEKEEGEVDETAGGPLQEGVPLTEERRNSLGQLARELGLESLSLTLEKEGGVLTDQDLRLINRALAVESGNVGGRLGIDLEGGDGETEGDDAAMRQEIATFNRLMLETGGKLAGYEAEAHGWNAMMADLDDEMGTIQNKLRQTELSAKLLWERLGSGSDTSPLHTLPLADAASGGGTQAQPHAGGGGTPESGGGSTSTNARVQKRVEQETKKLEAKYAQYMRKVEEYQKQIERLSRDKDKITHKKEKSEHQVALLHAELARLKEQKAESLRRLHLLDRKHRTVLGEKDAAITRLQREKNQMQSQAKRQEHKQEMIIQQAKRKEEDLLRKVKTMEHQQQQAQAQAKQQQQSNNKNRGGAGAGTGVANTQSGGKSGLTGAAAAGTSYPPNFPQRTHATGLNASGVNVPSLQRNAHRGEKAAGGAQGAGVAPAWLKAAETFLGEQKQRQAVHQKREGGEKEREKERGSTGMGSPTTTGSSSSSSPLPFSANAPSLAARLAAVQESLALPTGEDEGSDDDENDNDTATETQDLEAEEEALEAELQAALEGDGEEEEEDILVGVEGEGTEEGGASSAAGASGRGGRKRLETAVRRRRLRKRAERRQRQREREKNLGEGTEIAIREWAQALVERKVRAKRLEFELSALMMEADECVVREEKFRRKADEAQNQLASAKGTTSDCILRQYNEALAQADAAREEHHQLHVQAKKMKAEIGQLSVTVSPEALVRECSEATARAFADCQQDITPVLFEELTRLKLGLEVKEVQMGLVETERNALLQAEQTARVQAQRAQRQFRKRLQEKEKEIVENNELLMSWGVRQRQATVAAAQQQQQQALQVTGGGLQSLSGEATKPTAASAARQAAAPGTNVVRTRTQQQQQQAPAAQQWRLTGKNVLNQSSDDLARAAGGGGGGSGVPVRGRDRLRGQGGQGAAQQGTQQAPRYGEMMMGRQRSRAELSGALQGVSVMSFGPPQAGARGDNRRGRGDREERERGTVAASDVGSVRRGQAARGYAEREKEKERERGPPPRFESVSSNAAVSASSCPDNEEDVSQMLSGPSGGKLTASASQQPLQSGAAADSVAAAEAIFQQSRERQKKWEEKRRLMKLKNMETRPDNEQVLQSLDTLKEENEKDREEKLHQQAAFVEEAKAAAVFQQATGKSPPPALAVSGQEGGEGGEASSPSPPPTAFRVSASGRRSVESRAQSRTALDSGGSAVRNLLSQFQRQSGARASEIVEGDGAGGLKKKGSGDSSREFLSAESEVEDEITTEKEKEKAGQSVAELPSEDIPAASVDGEIGGEGEREKEQARIAEVEEEEDGLVEVDGRGRGENIGGGTEGEYSETEGGADDDMMGEGTITLTVEEEEEEDEEEEEEGETETEGDPNNPGMEEDHAEEDQLEEEGVGDGQTAGGEGTKTRRVKQFKTQQALIEMHEERQLRSTAHFREIKHLVDQLMASEQPVDVRAGLFALEQRVKEEMREQAAHCTALVGQTKKMGGDGGEREGGGVRRFMEERTFASPPFADVGPSSTSASASVSVFAGAQTSTDKRRSSQQAQSGGSPRLVSPKNGTQDVQALKSRLSSCVAQAIDGVGGGAALPSLSSVHHLHHKGEAEGGRSNLSGGVTGDGGGVCDLKGVSVCSQGRSHRSIATVRHTGSDSHSLGGTGSSSVFFAAEGDEGGRDRDRDREKDPNQPDRDRDRETESTAARTGGAHLDSTETHTSTGGGSNADKLPPIHHGSNSSTSQQNIATAAGSGGVSLEAPTEAEPHPTLRFVAVHGDGRRPSESRNLQESSRKTPAAAVCEDPTLVSHQLAELASSCHSLAARAGRQRQQQQQQQPQRRALPISQGQGGGSRSLAAAVRRHVTEVCGGASGMSTGGGGFRGMVPECLSLGVSPSPVGGVRGGESEGLVEGGEGGRRDLRGGRVLSVATPCEAVHGGLQEGDDSMLPSLSVSVESANGLRKEREKERRERPGPGGGLHGFASAGGQTGPFIHWRRAVDAHEHAIMCAAFDVEGDSGFSASSSSGAATGLVTGSWHSVVRRWNLERLSAERPEPLWEEAVARGPGTKAEAHAVKCLRTLAGGRGFVAAVGNGVRYIDDRTGKTELGWNFSSSSNAPVNTLAVIPQCSNSISASSSSSPNNNNNGSSTTGLLTSPDSALVAATGRDQWLRLFDLRVAERPLQQVKCPTELFALAYLPPPPCPNCSGTSNLDRNGSSSPSSCPSPSGGSPLSLLPSESFSSSSSTSRGTSGCPVCSATGSSPTSLLHGLVGGGRDRSIHFLEGRWRSLADSSHHDTVSSLVTMPISEIPTVNPQNQKSFLRGGAREREQPGGASPPRPGHTGVPGPRIERDSLGRFNHPGSGFVLVSGSRDHHVRLWGLSWQQSERRRVSEKDKEKDSIHGSADEEPQRAGGTVSSSSVCGGGNGSAKGSVGAVSLPLPRLHTFAAPLAPARAHQAYILSLTRVPRRGMIATACRDGIVKLWSVSGGKSSSGLGGEGSAERGLVGEGGERETEMEGHGGVGDCADRDLPISSSFSLSGQGSPPPPQSPADFFEIRQVGKSLAPSSGHPVNEVIATGDLVVAVSSDRSLRVWRWLNNG
uniref:Kinesin motor domain-containing protein n=1 Tax=Chromera velia CCMP2878 TaxID=1169474 RepID=A0A0K6SAM5_9ALVE|eukprot:Cvel_10316.t1-p1 / transcript=Cvel_10316.t1 / gene=Cvel_10316 / organism=Chromera_velia_CCMP2878 / gene_product=Kinesin-like protein KIF27, putative / transcript_product=Kinesin-like protein KIF27, putative / location=Cvel_scaffold619:40107-65702(+) / protein_length=3377 / sequence_SO=supercontig / SO=protein_coding / is_pseudo=false